MSVCACGASSRQPQDAPREPGPSATTGRAGSGQDTYMCRDFWALAASSLEL